MTTALQKLLASCNISAISRCENQPVPHLHCRLPHLLAAALLSSLFTAKTALADVYHFIAEDGTSHYSDQPSEPRYQLILRTRIDSKIATTCRPVRPGSGQSRHLFDQEIVTAAQAHQLDAALLHAVIEVESGYNPKAVSPKGAVGLMQLMPATARRYGVNNPFDVVQNLRGGAHLLRDLLDTFSGNKTLALAAYNAGAGAVLAHGRQVPPYIETTRYVPAVLKSYEQQHCAR
jgi:soluble lytic murein transglycosylase-like protein